MARPLNETPTGELVAAAAQAVSQEDFGRIVAELMLRFKNLVYAHALRLSRHDRALADDVFQETFIRIFQFLRDREGKPPVRSFAGLVAIVASRAAIDLLRARTRALGVEGSAVEVEDVARDESAHSMEMALYARQLLEELDPREREILSLLFIEGLSTNEVAGRLGIQANHVRQLKFRALQQIRVRHAIDAAAQLVEPL